MTTANPTIARHKPDPIPTVFPLPEREATGDRLAMYQATKTALQVPWMGVVTMAFSHYPQFYRTLWDGLSTLCTSAEFITACQALRATTEAAILPQPAIKPALAEAGYGAVELAQIEALIEVFSHGNMPYLLIATAARLLLAGHEIGTAATSNTLTPSTERHGPDATTPLTLIEPHHGTVDIQTLYQDIKATLGLPFVNTDYRALARWPSYFSVAWAGLKPQIGTPEHNQAIDTVHAKAVALIEGLPNPEGLTSEALIAAAKADGDLEAITDTVRLFQWLLPGLLVNVAIFQSQMRGGAGA